MDLSSLSLENFASDEKKYRKFFEDYNNWNEVPLLNHTPLHELKDLSLVRFRGMIQDIFNPEIYMEKYEINKIQNNEKLSKLNEDNKEKVYPRIQDGKYRDFLALESDEYVNYNSNSNVNGERQTMFVISIPGINNWVNDIENNENLKKLQEKIKELNKNLLESSIGSKEFNIQKRQINENEVNSVNNLLESCSQNVKNEKNKKIKKEIEEGAKNVPNNCNSLLSMSYLLNSPIAERPSKACMIKIYSDIETFKLNTIIEAIGFLSVDACLDGSTVNSEGITEEDNYEMLAINPPPSLIPRLHAITVKNLEHFNPLLNIKITEEEKSELNAKVIHDDLKILLKQCLFGDDIAADYLISHLISGIYAETDQGRIGHLPLNISNIPEKVLPEYAKNFYEILELILPASHYFPMTLENINQLQFIPKKDYKTNRLTSGLLQLAPFTHLVVDETKLQTGKLNSNGISNIEHLSHLIKEQKLRCDFNYYNIEYNADIPILVLSIGKTLLPCNVEIPLHIQDEENIEIIFETLKAAKQYLKPKLHNIRKYLTISKLQTFNLKDEYSKMIENDFVEMRKSSISGNKPLINIDTLHTLLILTRNIGKSHGKNTMDKELWDYAKHMEEIRSSRIESRNSKQK